MARYQAVRGTFDVLPGQISKWHEMEGAARDLAPRFGYQEIRTPLFEEAELFTRGMGVMAGLIEKELWTFNDKFGQKLALRTDATTGVIRAYQTNKLYNSHPPVKFFYLAPVFLLGKEGEERSRQSHQFGFEAIGSDNPALDAEVIALAAAYCDALGIEGYTIRLNSLGGKDCRPIYLQKLRDFFGSNQNTLCPTCKRKYKANPDWVLSCEESSCKSLSQVAPTIYGMLTGEAKSHFSSLREYLQEMDLPVELDPRVVRDSEYYNGTVVEIRKDNKTLGFGGRYDSLIEKLGGKATPGVGFAFSLEALIDASAENPKEGSTSNFDVLLRAEGPESAKLLVPLLFTLRQRGVSAEFDYCYSNGRRPRESKGEWAYLVTLDESNAFRGNAILRDVENETDEKVPVQRLRNRVLHVAGVSADEERDGSQSGRKKLRRGRKRYEEDDTKEEVKSSGDEPTESGSRSRKLRKSRRDSSNDEPEGRRSSRSQTRGEDTREPRENREARNPREGREPREARDDRETKSREQSSQAREPRERDTRDSERPRSSRDEGRANKNDRVSRTEDPERELGKALVPAFNLGGIGSAVPIPAAAKQFTAKKSSAVVPKSNTGGLNWSIKPGKDGSQEP